MTQKDIPKIYECSGCRGWRKTGENSRETNNGGWYNPSPEERRDLFSQGYKPKHTLCPTCFITKIKVDEGMTRERISKLVTEVFSNPPNISKQIH